MKKWLSAKSLMTVLAGICLAGFSSPASAATYQIQPGDTFHELSIAKNIPLQKLLAANPKADPLNLQIGASIHIPEAVPAKAPATASVTATAAAPAKATNKTTSTNLATQVVTTAAGKTLSYAKEFKAVASAYTASAAENGGWAGLDYMGNRLKVGTIAVDPKVIPLGSTVYVTGYKHGSLPSGGMIAKATDVGGAIKGNRIDIFVPGQNARSFGLQNVRVYVLK